MQSGKTTELNRRLGVMHALGYQVVYVNSSKDTRGKGFSTHNMVLTDTLPYTCVKVNNLMDAVDSITDEITLVGVDESQFYDDVLEFYNHVVINLGKRLVMSGLVGDFRRELFGNLYKLFSHADQINFIRSWCTLCSKNGHFTPAPFTHRKTLTNETILVGGSDSYNPLCRKCYQQSTKNSSKNLSKDKDGSS